MEIYHHINDFKGCENAVLTTGTFDGVHIGHQKILSRLNAVARSCKGESVLLTFSPHPRLVLDPNATIKLLNSTAEKIKLLEQFGVDHLIIHPFTKEFSELSSTAFLKEILVKKLHVKKLVIGYDHHFGKNREGSFEHLASHASAYGFEVEEIKAQDIDDVKVSSTKIRKALEDGDIQTATTYLGHSFLIDGQVKEGAKIGRTIGFPTANLAVNQHQLIPKNGVYATLVHIDDVVYEGMLNIGVNPTIALNNNVKIEVHIFNFETSIYGKTIALELLKRIRDEQQFANIDALKKQLATDKQNCSRITNIHLPVLK